jgi:hypothetical protein
VTVDWIINIRRNRFKLYKPLLYPLEEHIQTTKKGMEDLNPYVYAFGPINADVNDGKGNISSTEINAYLYHQDIVLKPHEFRGILFRVHNVAIGSYFADDLRLYSENPIILHQTLMEVYLDKGFQSIVNLDREGLYEGSNTYRHLRYFLENFLNGKVPERPIIKEPTPEEKEENVPSKEYREKQEREFIKVEQEIFKPHAGVIYQIKKRMREKRKKKLKATSPLDVVLSEYQAKFNAPLKIKRLEDFKEDFNLRETDDAVEIQIPRFKGTRAKLWESLILSALLYLNLEDDKTKMFLSELIKLYKVNENKNLD